MDLESLRQMRDRFGIPVKDEDLASYPYFKPAPDSPEGKYMRERREALGGYPRNAAPRASACRRRR